MTSPSLVPGTVLVCLLVALGRWGSYLGWPSRNVFLTEVLLLLGGCWLLVRRRPSLLATRLDRGFLVPLACLLGWVGVRFVLSGQPDLDALRDVAPYAYAALALLASVPTGPAARRRTEVALLAALGLHALWVLVVVLRPDLPQHLPLLGGKVRVLELRPDVDGAALAVLAALALSCAVNRTDRWLRAACAALAAAAGWLVLQTASRAALLALVAALVVVLGRDARRLRPGLLTRRRALAAAAVLGLCFLAVPQTDTYQRLSGSADVSNDAGGTASARQAAYGDVLDYLHGDVGRTALGIGFGPDFLAISGAAEKYEGTTYTDVRAPHNYLLNTYARLGLVGVVLMLWVLASAGRAFVEALRVPSAGVVTAAAIATTLLVTSQFGVILESPFGAVPFWWSVGLLAAVAREQARVADHPPTHGPLLEAEVGTEPPATASGLGWPGGTRSGGAAGVGWPE